MTLKYFIPVIALATAANALPFKIAPTGEIGWIWANNKGIDKQMGQHRFDNSSFGLKVELGAIARKTIVADLFVQAGIVSGGSFIQFQRRNVPENRLDKIRSNVGFPLAAGYTILNKINVLAGAQINVEHGNIHYLIDRYTDFQVKYDFTAEISYNITENNELGIKLTIRPNETALGVSYNYWIF